MSKITEDELESEYYRGFSNGIKRNEKHSELPSPDCYQLPHTTQTCFVMAARYAHTRRTGASLAVVTAILENWDRLSESTKEQIKREAKNEVTCNFEDWERLEPLT